MRILRAAPHGMCCGVRDALALALEHANDGPLTILGELVHNPAVLDDLHARGISVAPDAEHAGTPVVMVTAHGTSERSLAATRALGLTVHYSAVSNFELGTREPDLLVVLRYARLAGVPMESIVDDNLNLPE